MNVKNALGRTPLHEAAAIGDKAAVEVLVNSGADVNVKDKQNRTPLHLAATHEVRVLLKKHGAKE